MRDTCNFYWIKFYREVFTNFKAKANALQESDWYIVCTLLASRRTYKIVIATEPDIHNVTLSHERCVINTVQWLSTWKDHNHIIFCWTRISYIVLFTFSCEQVPEQTFSYVHSHRKQQKINNGRWYINNKMIKAIANCSKMMTETQGFCSKIKAQYFWQIAIWVKKMNVIAVFFKVWS